MIAYKLFGSLLIVGSAVLFSLQSQRFENEKIKQTDAFILLIRFIKKQIDCFCLPLHKILKNADLELIKKCGFKHTDLKTLPSDKPFEYFISECDMYMDNEAKNLLERFSSELGKSYRNEQVKSCEYYISELEAYKSNLEKELPKKKKMRMAITLCASLSFVLIML